MLTASNLHLKTNVLCLRKNNCRIDHSTFKDDPPSPSPSPLNRIICVTRCLFRWCVFVCCLQRMTFKLIYNNITSMLDIPILLFFPAHMKLLLFHCAKRGISFILRVGIIFSVREFQRESRQRTFQWYHKK